MFAVTDTALSVAVPALHPRQRRRGVPDPVAPLTRTTYLWESELGWRDAYERMGAFELDEFPPDEFCILGVAGGYCYLNASVMRLFGERAPGMSWQVIDEQFFGAQPGIPDYEEQPGDVRPDLSVEAGGDDRLGRSPQSNVDDLDRLTEHREPHDRAASESSGRSSTSMRDRSCGTHAGRFLPFHRELFSEHLFVTTLASVPVGCHLGRRRGGRSARPDPAAHGRGR